MLGIKVLHSSSACSKVQMWNEVCIRFSLRIILMVVGWGQSKKRKTFGKKSQNLKLEMDMTK